MKFWVVKWESCIGIDNESVAEADMTALPANVNFMMWEGNTGTVHYDDRPSLAERINDPTPYLPFLDEFITLGAVGEPPITLQQAKTIKSDASDLIFNALRQVPISYIAYSWDARDEEASAMNNLLTRYSRSTPTPPATVDWYPIGSVTPVSMTLPQLAGLLGEISSRRDDLDLVRRTKRAAIDACATVAAVVAINVGTGW